MIGDSFGFSVESLDLLLDFHHQTVGNAKSRMGAPSTISIKKKHFRGRLSTRLYQRRSQSFAHKPALNQMPS